MNNNNDHKQLFQQKSLENKQNNEEQQSESNAVYTVNIDLAEVLRVFSDSMIKAYQLGLEQNQNNQNNERYPF